MFEARGNQLDDDESHDFEDNDAISATATGTF